MNKEEMRNAVDLYIKFMYNYWSYSTCIKVFKATVYSHIWYKWVELVGTYGKDGAIPMLWCSIDKESQQTLIEAATEYVK